jgi:hypothetical protein
VPHVDGRRASLSVSSRPASAQRRQRSGIVCSTFRSTRDSSPRGSSPYARPRSRATPAARHAESGPRSAPSIGPSARSPIDDLSIADRRPVV